MKINLDDDTADMIFVIGCPHDDIEPCDECCRDRLKMHISQLEPVEFDEDEDDWDIPEWDD